MSITVTTDLVCDACGAWATGVTGTDRAEIRQARRRLRAVGWRRPNGQDLCPECAGTASDETVYRLPG